MRRIILSVIILTFMGSAFATGGDTVRLSSRYRYYVYNDAIRDTIWHWYWRDPIDSIVKTLNGRAGNINLSSTANIDPAKLDTTKNLWMRTIKSGTITADSMRLNRGISVDSLSVKRIKNGSLGRVVISKPSVDSITGTFSYSKVDSADRLVVRQILCVNDSLHPSSPIGAIANLDYVYTKAISCRVRTDTTGGFAAIDTLQTRVGIMDSLDVRSIIADTIRGRVINGDSIGKFVLGYGGFTAYQRDTVDYIYRVFPDTIIELYFRGISGTSNGSGIASDSTIPAFLCPRVSVNQPIVVLDSNYVLVPGVVDIYPDGAGTSIYPVKIVGNRITYTGSFWAALTKGYYKFSVRYKK